MSGIPARGAPVDGLGGIAQEGITTAPPPSPWPTRAGNAPLPGSGGRLRGGATGREGAERASDVSCSGGGVGAAGGAAPGGASLSSNGEVEGELPSLPSPGSLLAVVSDSSSWPPCWESCRPAARWPPEGAPPTSPPFCNLAPGVGCCIDLRSRPAVPPGPNSSVGGCGGPPAGPPASGRRLFRIGAAAGGGFGSSRSCYLISPSPTARGTQGLRALPAAPPPPPLNVRHLSLYGAEAADLPVRR